MKYVIHFGFILCVLVIGCGAPELPVDEWYVDVPEHVKIAGYDPTLPSIVGQWTILTIDGKTPKEYFYEDVEDNLKHMFGVSFDFSKDGEWSLHLSIHTPNTDEGASWAMGVRASLKGTWTQDGESITITAKNAIARVGVVPREYSDKVLGRSKSSFEKQWAADLFRKEQISGVYSVPHNPSDISMLKSDGMKIVITRVYSGGKM